MDDAVKQAWREAEAIHGARPVALSPSSADEAAEAETLVELVKPNRGGAGTHMGVVERQEIALTYLTDKRLHTVSALAKHFNRSREAIAGCLKGAEFDKLADEVRAHRVKMAKAKIDGAVGQATDAWIESLSIASAKGDHRPAKDLLLVTKTVAMPTEEKGGGCRCSSASRMVRQGHPGVMKLSRH